MILLFCEKGWLSNLKNPPDLHRCLEWYAGKIEEQVKCLSCIRKTQIWFMSSHLVPQQSPEWYLNT